MKVPISQNDKKPLEGPSLQQSTSKSVESSNSPKPNTPAEMHSINTITLTPANFSSPKSPAAMHSINSITLTPAKASGPGPSFSGPGPSFSGPGPSFSGPGPSFSGPGPSDSSLNQLKGISVVSSGPGSNWKKQQEDAKNEKPNFPTKTPDGRDIIYKGPPCSNCGEMIIGQCMTALGKTYHPEHFVCTCCSQPFIGGKFMIHENEPYCDTDYYELFGNKCKNCNDSIRDQYIKAGENYFHPDHFVCSTCGIKLVGKKFKVNEENQDVLCMDCHIKRIDLAQVGNKICAKCLQPIVGEFIVLKGQNMHPEHYRCEECGCAFVGGNCHEFEGALYCTNHYEKLLKKTCAKCRKPILGRGVSAMSRMWHPEHFGCFICECVLNEHSFFEKDGHAYCETHYSALFAKICGHCHGPILGDGRSFLDKVYHIEHFVCSVCDSQLKLGHIREWDQKPYCTNCYEKLPSEVRKKYEKKKKTETVIENKHEAQIRKEKAKEEKAKAKEEREKEKAKKKPK